MLSCGLRRRFPSTSRSVSCGAPAAFASWLRHQHDYCKHAGSDWELTLTAINENAVQTFGTCLFGLLLPPLTTGLTEGMTALPRYSNFARHLRDARIRRGLSSAEVADLVGVSHASVYFWETDHCRPRDYNLTALCRVLRLPIRATRAMAVG